MGISDTVSYFVSPYIIELYIKENTCFMFFRDGWSTNFCLIEKQSDGNYLFRYSLMRGKDSIDRSVLKTPKQYQVFLKRLRRITWFWRHTYETRDSIQDIGCSQICSSDINLDSICLGKFPINYKEMLRLMQEYFDFGDQQLF